MIDDVKKLPFDQLIQELKVLEEEQKQYSKLTGLLESGAFLDDVLEHIYSHFNSVIPYDRISIALLSPNKETLSVRWVKSKSEELFIDRSYSAVMKGSSLEEILKSGEPRIISDLERYFLEHPKSYSTELILKEGIRSSLTCPLITKKTPVGFLFFSSFNKNVYTESHIAQFKIVTALLSLLIEKGNLHEKLNEIDHEKNRVLGVAAHDLRSPIGIISGYVEILKDSAEDGTIKNYEHLFNRVLSKCDEMLSLINDLLDISAIESGTFLLHPKEIDLYDYFFDQYETQKILASKKKLSLTHNLTKKLGTGRIDVDRFSQVISNLLGNSFKYSKPNTEVELILTKKIDLLEIIIKDHGVGFDLEKLAPLGTSFNRGSAKSTNNEKSTGLGLAIVKKIISAHGGEMNIASTPNIGTTVTLIIPI